MKKSLIIALIIIVIGIIVSIILINSNNNVKETENEYLKECGVNPKEYYSNEDTVLYTYCIDYINVDGVTLKEYLKENNNKLNFDNLKKMIDDDVLDYKLLRDFKFNDNGKEIIHNKLTIATLEVFDEISNKKTNYLFLVPEAGSGNHHYSELIK